MSEVRSRFAEQVALVTGAAGGIGSAVAARFAAEGARTVLADRDGAGLERQAAILAATGSQPVVVVADVSTEIGAEAVVAAAAEAHGRLDIAALIAGIAGTPAPAHQMTTAAWDNVLTANLRSVFLTQRAALRYMVDNAIPGVVINMSSSMAQWDVLDGGAAYAASKAAILALTRSAALDMARYGIRVNAVCPGVVDTMLGIPRSRGTSPAQAAQHFEQRIPLRRVGQPRDVAAVVAFLASADAAHVTGVGWLIDGGQTLQSWSNAPHAVAYPKQHATRDDRSPDPPWRYP
jgi:NAD(P)-dependent dehydrogenase (short-subunit alcohol dehydrogenase family)